MLVSDYLFLLQDDILQTGHDALVHRHVAPLRHRRLSRLGRVSAFADQVTLIGVTMFLQHLQETIYRLADHLVLVESDHLVCEGLDALAIDGHQLSVLDAGAVQDVQE